MQDRETLVQICRDIVAEGMTPGVGLLRARAPFKISVAQAIEVLKSYKHDRPLRKTNEAPEPQTEQQALELRVVALEERVVQLEAQLQQMRETHSG